MHPKTHTTPKHLTITDHETKHLTQQETHIYTFAQLRHHNFNLALTQPIKYNYNHHTKTTTITQ